MPGTRRPREGCDTPSGEGMQARMCPVAGKQGLGGTWAPLGQVGRVRACFALVVLIAGERRSYAMDAVSSGAVPRLDNLAASEVKGGSHETEFPRHAYLLGLPRAP